MNQYQYHVLAKFAVQWCFVFGLGAVGTFLLVQFTGLEVAASPLKLLMALGLPVIVVTFLMGLPYWHLLRVARAQRKQLTDGAENSNNV